MPQVNRVARNACITGCRPVKYSAIIRSNPIVMLCCYLTSSTSVFIVPGMKDLFLADAHLLNPEDSNYQRLLTFLQDQVGQLRTLVLLGDIFEFWIGYRHLVFSRYLPLLETLRKIRESGTEIVYVEGNHDFHLGPYFQETLGCRILADGGDLELDGVVFHLAHGDLVNPDDKGYRRLRAFFRSRLVQFLIKVVPPDLTWAIGRGLGRQSEKSHERKRAFNPESLLTKYAEKQLGGATRYVITGHFHSPLCKQLEQGNLVALGDWISQDSYALWEDGTLSLYQADAAAISC